MLCGVPVNSDPRLTTICYLALNINHNSTTHCISHSKMHFCLEDVVIVVGSCESTLCNL